MTIEMEPADRFFGGGVCADRADALEKHENGGVADCFVSFTLARLESLKK